MSDGKGRKAEGERGEKEEMYLSRALHSIQSKHVYLSHVVKEVIENGKVE